MAGLHAGELAPPQEARPTRSVSGIACGEWYTTSARRGRAAGGPVPPYSRSQPRFSVFIACGGYDPTVTVVVSSAERPSFVTFTFTS